MSQWTIKHFKKKKAVRCIIYYPEKRVRIYWAIPKDDLVTIKGKVYSCDSTKHYFSLLNGIPTFTYLVNKPEPLLVDDIKNSPIMSSAEFNVAINNRVVKDIFTSADKKLDLVLAVIVGMVAVVLIVGVAGYFLYQKMEAFGVSLDEIRAILRTVTGS